MYDLNVAVPDLNAKKYTLEDKFKLLKHYLYELNDSLSYALSDLDLTNCSVTLKTQIEGGAKAATAAMQLKTDQLEKFSRLKSEILRTADEITRSYETAIQKSETEILQTASSLYATASAFGEYQNKTDTAIRQNADALTLHAQQIDAVETDLETYKKTNNAALELTADAITAGVKDEFVSKSELGEYQDEISSQMTQTAENITEVYSRTGSLSDGLSALGSDVSSFISALNAYIRRGELEEGVYGIEIGRSDSNIRARFTNERLSFYQGASEVAYISGSNLYITRAEVLDYLRLGNESEGYYTFDMTENGLEVRWNEHV